MVDSVEDINLDRYHRVWNNQLDEKEHLSNEERVMNMCVLFSHSRPLVLSTQ